MSELTITLLRFGFLALLWLLVAAIVLSQARDLSVGQRRRRRDPRREQARAQRQAPAPPQPARHLPGELVMLEGPAAGTSYPLGSAPVLLGRSPEAAVPLQDDYASGRHARLFPQGSRWFLEDLGSTNGTYLDDQRLTRAVALEPGRRFRIGRTVMELRD